MSMSRRRAAALVVLLTALGASASGFAQAPPGIGQPATPDQIAGWNIDVRPDGQGLPLGSGTVAQGHDVFNQRCASCHGEDLKGQMGALVGGIGSLASGKPLRTVGSYWPYATTLFDYVHRAMPFDAPQTLSADEVYAVSAYVLFRNDIIEEADVMNADTLPKVRMPNRDGFERPDPRPDVYNTPCRTDCKKAQPTPQTGAPPGAGGSNAPTRTGVGGGGAPQ